MGRCEGLLGQAPVGLDFGQFGHGPCRRYCGRHASREAHWADLYKEVVTSGLCTGCAACIIACPHDVLNYDDGDGTTGRGRSRPTAVPPTAPTG
jgi:Fe-S-cluster-containing hydrogenase component 2